jgi:transposase
LPAQLKAQISRELDRIELLMNQLKIVEAERDALLEPASEAAPTPAVMLAQLKGIGSQIAAMLWSEALYRHFDNRRQVAAYAGLAPTPWKSGSIDHEQGVSKAGNPRLRTTMIQVACPGGVALDTPPARLGAEPVVLRAGAAQRRSDAKDHDRSLGAEASGGVLEVRDQRCRHRGCRHAGRITALNTIPRA